MYVKKWQPQTSTFFGVSEVSHGNLTSNITNPRKVGKVAAPWVSLLVRPTTTVKERLFAPRNWRINGFVHLHWSHKNRLYINIPHMDPMCHRTSKIEPKNEWWEFSRGEIILLLRLVEGVLPFFLMVATWQSTSRGYACIFIWYRNARNLRTAFFYI